MGQYIVAATPCYCDDVAPSNRPTVRHHFQGYRKETNATVEWIWCRQINYKWNWFVLQHCYYAKLKELTLFVHQSEHVHYYLHNIMSILLWNPWLNTSISVPINKKNCPKFLILIHRICHIANLDIVLTLILWKSSFQVNSIMFLCELWIVKLILINVT